MSTMNKMARVCLAAPGRESSMKTVSLHLCLTGSYLHDICELVCKAIGNGRVKSVELALPTKKADLDCGNMVAKNLVCFFYAFPNLLQCTTRLVLHNARFNELEMCHLLNSCEQLQHLELNNCDTGRLSTLKINMPNSKISYLRLESCCFEKVELSCLPKLAILYCESWFSLNAPLSFGCVPCLEELSLVCSAARNQYGLNLSELLHGTVEIKALTLDFHGEKVKNSYACYYSFCYHVASAGVGNRTRTC
ncbi:hypothetical protein PR202_ga26685 [Eleusine coracana subsp. coracana]|uniref:Uncharacterized protein n=1 Tax=Eleusine coracana subsp. coracana TaxID=191504 RepID=A0AAV5DDZ5_ELECO|nr:hypothetical protein PR202_ga26685 [Eleusine coracana subsp. coracana]